MTTLTFSRLVPRLFHRSVFLFLWLSAVSYCGAQPVYRHVFLDGDRLVCVTDGGDTLAFSARDQGGVTFFDTLNPFKILVFSRPFQKIYYLDHRLSPLSEAISLTDLGLGEVICVCASKYGGFWVYDRWRESLVRLTNRPGRLLSANPFLFWGWVRCSLQVSVSRATGCCCLVPARRCMPLTFSAASWAKPWNRSVRGGI